MSKSLQHVSEVNRLRTAQKIERKLEALERYVKDGAADFEIPKKFTLNWFAGLASEPYESLSKGSELLRTGSAMHERVISALARAQEALEGGRVEQGVCKKTKRIEELEAKVRKYEALIPGLSQTIVDLLEEVGELKRCLSVQQAQWADKRHSFSGTK